VSACAEVVGVGFAAVDVIAHVKRLSSDRPDIDRDEDRAATPGEAQTLCLQIGRHQLAPGGSAANLMAGLASLGVPAAFFGRTGRDLLSRRFLGDLRARGVACHAAPAPDLPTGCCLHLIDPEGRRRVRAYSGASALFGPGNLDPAAIRGARLVALEGRLLELPEGAEIIDAAMRAARAGGTRIALKLPERASTSRHRAALVEIGERGVDLLFASGASLAALCGTEEAEEALGLVGSLVPFAAMSQERNGWSIRARGRRSFIPLAKPLAVGDMIGADSLFAAGATLGLLAGRSLEEAGWLGGLCAWEALTHSGARPRAHLAEHVKRHWHRSGAAGRAYLQAASQR
jgi:sugar/nucleoside kinase (ribokinase family)